MNFEVLKITAPTVVHQTKLRPVWQSWGQCIQYKRQVELNGTMLVPCKPNRFSVGPTGNCQGLSIDSLQKHVTCSKGEQYIL